LYATVTVEKNARGLGRVIIRLCNIGNLNEERKLKNPVPIFKTANVSTRGMCRNDSKSCVAVDIAHGRSFGCPILIVVLDDTCTSSVNESVIQGHFYYRESRSRDTGIRVYELYK
jgi:hypothetical protein